MVGVCNGAVTGAGQVFGFAVNLANGQLLYSNTRGGDLITGHVSLNVAGLLHMHKSFGKDAPDGDEIPADDGSDAAPGTRIRQRRGACNPLVKHTLIDKLWDFGELTLPPVVIWPMPVVTVSMYISASATFKTGFQLKACLTDLMVVSATEPRLGVTMEGGVSVGVVIAEVSMAVHVTVFDSTITGEHRLRLHVTPEVYVKGCFDIVQNSEAFGGRVVVTLKILCLFGKCLYKGSSTIATWEGIVSRTTLATNCPAVVDAGDIEDESKQVHPPTLQVISHGCPIRRRTMQHQRRIQ